MLHFTKKKKKQTAAEDSPPSIQSDPALENSGRISLPKEKLK
jgi:hypothetical protein